MTFQRKPSRPWKLHAKGKVVNVAGVKEPVQHAKCATDIGPDGSFADHVEKVTCKRCQKVIFQELLSELNHEEL